MKPLITALIDTYNHERYIEQALVSVLEQGLSAEEMEIVVVDDGSTDKTPSILQKFAPRVKHVRKGNGGQGSAVNLGVQIARGQFIALLDADDYWLPGKVHRVVREFEANPSAGMVHHRMLELDARSGELREGQFLPLNGNVAATKESIWKFNPTSMSSLAFRKAILEKVLPIPEAITIQADGYIQALAVFLAPVAAIDEPLGIYRFHGSNLYFLSEAREDRDKDMERRKRRAMTLRALVDGLRGWFRAQGYDLDQQPVRATLKRWTTMLEREEFAVMAPGRIRFFRHLFESSRDHLDLMNWRLKMINYFNISGSLVVGYKHFHKLDEWRERLTGRVHTRGVAGPSARRHTAAP